MTIAQELVRNVLDTKFENFDKATINKAKLRITDTIAALISGIHSSGVGMLLDVMKEWGGKPESTVLGYGDKIPAANAAFVMGIAARSNDFEPSGGPQVNGKSTPGHYSSTMVTTAFAMTEKMGKSGKDLITALILGDDLASRIGLAGGSTMDLGWDPSGMYSRFGATAIAGKLMGLNENQMLNAMGIVLNQISSNMQSVLDFTHCYKMQQGMAGWNGIFSAELAKRGFTGPKDPFTSKFGYFHQYCKNVDLQIITEDLGKIFYADEVFKLYPVCRVSAAAVECMLRLVQENDVDPQSVTEIVIDINPGHKDSFAGQPFKITDCAQAGAALNISYNVASVLLRKSIKLEYYTDEFICDPKISELTKRIRLNPDPQVRPLAAVITLILNNSQVLSESVEVPRGSLTRQEEEEKFMAGFAFTKVISQTKAKKALEMLGRLETLDNLADLISTLVPDDRR